ncbi:uncharacterized protein LOC128206309 [Mya arenaria]|uniref:uncharacterized protein LOC128206309 n=1 Tax=Mya arenaria TaxID=6604 RepID=UPI0022DFB15C|nr:uncharacterized protein LOC128206309 [Mya arenaria]
MASRTDNVPNWFVAAPGMKAKKLEITASEDLNYVGYFDSPQKWKRSEDDKFDPFTPAKRYDMLKRGPSEKRAYKIIPSPVNMLVYDQPTMPFDSKSWVVTGSKDFEGEMQFLADKLKMKIKATSSSFQKQIQFIKTTDEIGGKEAYLLGITPNTSKIEIKASDNAGAFYGAQTLLSLLEDNGGVLPQSIVRDFPRYEYRGVMIDVARNFKSKAWMLKLIDTMAMYKLNKLHLHLSDDESWRIEIPAIPELTEVASKRCHSEYKDKCVLPQWGSGPDSDTSGSGFYTVEDYREMLEYAKARHIEIIPEIDMPGHSAAAMAAMEKREDDIDFMKMHGYIPLPESLLLNDRGIHENVSSFQKWTKNAMNPCMNSTFRFVELVVDGLKRLHMHIQPLRIFHMGGSEVVQGAWDGSHECLMNSELKTFDMAALRRFFMNRVTDVVATKGLKLGVWEDGVYAENKPNPITDFKSDVFVYPWDNRWELDHAKRPSEFADAGYKVVLPLVTHLYFDLAQEPDPETRGFYWATRYSDTHKLFGLMPDDIYANADVDSMGNTVTLESLCENQPCPQPNKTENIIGLQACVWTDIIRTEEQIESMIFPRLLALAERAWHEADWESIKDKTERDSKKQADWEVFSDVMGHKELPRLERNSIFYLVDPPGAKVVNKVLTTNVRYPNHTVELSRDGGKVWQTFQEQELPLGEHEIHFRTRSPVLGRYSRAVKMTAHVSDHIKGLNQGELDELASSLQIRVKVLDNLRNDGNRHIVQTTLKNIGQSPIPDVGWTLYFHSMLLAFPDSFQHEHNKTVDMDIEKVQFGVVQGDLYYMKPILGFAPISPGKERVYNIIVQLWAVSKTDFMPLWYVSSDTEGVTPRVVKSTSSFDLDYVEDFGDIKQWKRSRADRYNPYSPQDRWSKFRFLGNQKVESVVIPTPKKIERQEDGPFIMFDYSWKVFDVNGSFSEIAKYMKEMFKVDSSVSDGRNLIKLIKNATLPGQAYLLQIEAENQNIVLQSSTPQGMFYAVQSLRAIIDDTNRVNIPSMTLEDAPRYEWRGMHLDVARNFHSLEDVKRLIKAMAMYKMNLLHLHLTDDEGWRIEIPGLPELTKIGSRRCHDLNETQCIIPQFGSGPFADSSGTGYYTTAEYKDLLRFAKKHFITVVPEFDTPGHCHAAVVSMECRYNKFKMTGDDTSANEYRLVDPEDVSFYRSVQNWRDNAINPCINSTYKFIAKIIDEIKSMHQDIQPLVTYHFGGDEVAKEAWTHSPMCQKFLTSNPKYNVTHGLKNYFVTRVAEIAAAKNVKLGGWDDGFLNGQSSPEPIPISEFSNAELFVNTWNNIWEWGGGSNAYKFANAGFKVILTQATNLYFDHPQEPDPEERGLYWATRFTDTKKVFRFMPESLYDNIFEDKSGGPLSKVEICGEDMSKCTLLEKPENVIGMQGALWSETVRTSQNMDYMIYPRLLALAERSWHKASFEDQSDNIEVFENEWISFSEALGLREFKRLDDLGISFRVPPPGARLLENGEMQVSTTYPGLGVEVSKDNGTTWQQVPEEIVNNPNRSRVVKSEGDWHSVKLRTTFRNGDKTRYSRSITLNKEVARPVVEQYMLNYIAENLLVHVEVIDNLNKDYNNYMTVKLELTNNGSMNIPSSAWRIYFYSLYGAKDSELRCGLTVGHVNGGLFYIEPTPGSFPGIPAMQSLNPCTYNNKWWMVSRTDNMPNWFVTAPGMKAMKLKATESETLSYVGKFDTAAKWKRTREDRFDPYTAPERYDILRRNPSSKPVYRVVPTPMMSTFSKHETIHVDHLFVVVESQEFKRESQFLAETLKVNNVTTALDSSKQIKFEMKQNLGGSDAYEIKISPETHTVVIQAQEAPGAFYGAQTLISLVEDNDGNIPKATIRDAPRFGYRGVMLDVARNFKPKNWMLKFIDVMATYKLNKLHLHLSDDEAWRIEIPDIPGLTQIASKRCHSEYSDECVMPQLGSGPDTDTIGSGFYTVDDYREILDYANARHIEVIPEIDMPGHSAAAITVMEKREDEIDFMESHVYGPLPESWLLYDHKFTPSVYSVQKWLKNAMNPCMNSTYRFVERVVDGLKELHRPVQPLRIFHMGGDEVAHGAWSESRECFDNVEFRGKDTAALQRVFMSRVSRIISDKGLNLGVWEDGVYADDKPNPITDFKSDVFVYPWNNRWGTNKAKRSSEFADAGYKVILPLATHLYFDMPQEPDPESRGLYWATRFIDAHKVFGLMPDNIFANVDVDRMGNSVSLEDLCGNAACPQPNKTENIIGLQACMWAEVMRTEEQFHNMAFPRLLALAERAWHRANWEEIEDRNARDAYRSSDWEAFADVLGYKELPRLEKKQVFYLVEPPGARVEGNVLMANTRYPNHVVEISMDGGDSWNEFQQQTLANGKYKFHFRTKSPVLGRVSRPVELMAVVEGDGRVGSAASSTLTYLTILVTFVHIYMFWRVL